METDLRTDEALMLAYRDGEGAASAPAPSESAAQRNKMAEEKLGTGHGERIHAPTQSTQFRRASTMPSETIAIYYDSRQNLIALGIIPRQAKLPQPFPNGGFVPDPS